MTTTTTTPETDQRLSILSSFLSCPHRDLTSLWAVHEPISWSDPLFYRQLAAWYSSHGDVRDHVEAFTAGLCLSTFPGSRDVGLAILEDLPPYQVARVVDFVHGREVKRTTGVIVRDAEGKELRR